MFIKSFGEKIIKIGELEIKTSDEIIVEYLDEKYTGKQTTTFNKGGETFKNK